MTSEECDDGNTDETDSCSSACEVQDVVAWPPASTSSPTLPPAHGHALGNGRNPISSSALGVAVVARDLSTGAIDLRWMGPSGENVTPSSVTVSGTLTPADESDASVACADSGDCVVAWADLAIDGSGTGIALAKVAFGGTPSAPIAANDQTDYDQYKPDIVWTGTNYVVAWTDEANLDTAPDIYVRTFDENLVPAGPAVALAATPDAESDVSLNVDLYWAGGFYSAWRVSNAAEGTDELHGLSPALATTCVLTGHRAGLADERPTVSSDTYYSYSWWVVAYGESIDPDSDGEPGQLAVADDLCINGAPSSRPGITLSLTESPYDQIHRPSFASADGAIYFAYERTDTQMGWLIDAVNVTDRVPLPRSPSYAPPMRRSVLVAARPLHAFVAAWDDLNKQTRPDEADEDVAVEFIPIPVLRTDPSSSESWKH